MCLSVTPVQFLYSYGERAPLVDDGQTAPKEYDELTEVSQSDHNNKCTFEIVGTVTGKSGTKRPHVLEEYDVRNNNLRTQLYHVQKHS